MIGFLSGTVKRLSQEVLINVNGVGYRVEVGEGLLASLQDGQEAELYIYTHVREDSLDLYGFASEKDLLLFEMVIGVNGVGPKVGLALVDTGAERLVNAVQNAEVGFFKAVPRVGKKLAQKIIIELKSKMGGLKELNLGPLSEKEQDVAEGLKGLGFDEDSIHQVLGDVDQEQSVEVMLKEAVKKISSL
jgi:Holliday junction DNA helicase RuvA